MSKITGRFATKDNRHTVEVAIYNKDITLPNINIDTSHNVKFAGESPIVITQQQSDTFDHLFKTQCKISLLSKQWLGEYLYANNNLSIVVNVWVDNDCVFAGYVTPNTYNQNYSHEWENIDINCVDMLSTLKERRLTDKTDYSELVAQSQIRPFKWFIDQMEIDTKTIVIPNLPDVNYGEAEMMWAETGWTRVVNDDGTITYYGIESEIMMLDEETGVNTGNERQGELKTVTWVASEDTKIIDGVPYYVEYAHIQVAGQDTNTGDWRATTDIADDVLPVPTGTVNRVDGWTRGALPQPFEYYEHYTTFTIYDNGMEVASSDGIGDQIPETPDTTTNGSYYEFRQGSDTDLDIDETTGYLYFKNYCWVIVNDVAQNSGDWVRGNALPQIAGKTVSSVTTAPTATLRIGETRTTYTATFDNDTKYFEFDNLPNDVTRFSTTYFWSGATQEDIEVRLDNADDYEELTFYNFDTSNCSLINLSYHGNFDYNDTLKHLDVTRLDTSKTTSMYSMFLNCGGLTYIDLSNLDTSYATTMYQMFRGCKNLEHINVSSFDTSKVTTMNMMFASCRSLTSLDVSNFDLSSIGTNTNGAKGTLESMFSNCTYLTTLNLSNWDISWNATRNLNGLLHRIFDLTPLAYLTMNNVNDYTFTYISKQTPHSCTIYRDGTTYLYNSNTNTWEIQ